MTAPGFAAWMAEVDQELSRRCGFTSGDLTDYGYRDAYSDELTPGEVAGEVLTDNFGGEYGDQ